MSIEILSQILSYWSHNHDTIFLLKCSLFNTQATHGHHNIVRFATKYYYCIKWLSFTKTVTYQILSVKSSRPIFNSQTNNCYRILIFKFRWDDVFLPIEFFHMIDISMGYFIDTFWKCVKIAFPLFDYFECFLTHKKRKFFYPYI